MIIRRSSTRASIWPAFPAVHGGRVWFCALLLLSNLVCCSFRALFRKFEAWTLNHINLSLVRPEQEVGPHTKTKSENILSKKSDRGKQMKFLQRPQIFLITGTKTTDYFHYKNDEK
jgi:hypothetical protein